MQPAEAAWKHAGDTDRAEALLRQVLDLGGEEFGFARFELAELCFERGAEDDAWAHLAVLEKTESAGSGPAELGPPVLVRMTNWAWWRLAVCATASGWPSWP